MGADLLLVDWLPRGGITQTTAAWRDVARAAGLRVAVVGRAGVELAPDVAVERRLPTKVGALEAHRRVVAAAVRTIREERPSVVYVQHTWLPLLERRVLQAAAEVGARTVLAVHNAVPHERFAGLRAGMAGLLSDADDIVAHSRHVADQLVHPRVQVIGLPDFTVITHARPEPLDDLAPARRRRAVAFGVLGRGYKGVGSLSGVAASLGPDWEVVAAGVGAGQAGAGVRTHQGYLTGAQLHWLLDSADAVLLPYEAASQSGAVDVAQTLGTPPVATAVGGIPEQIDDGVTGGLVAHGADPDAWAAAITRTVAHVDPSALRADRAAARARSTDAWMALIAGTRRRRAERFGRPRRRESVGLGR